MGSPLILLFYYPIRQSLCCISADLAVSPGSPEYQESSQNESGKLEYLYKSGYKSNICHQMLSEDIFFDILKSIECSCVALLSRRMKPIAY